MKKETIGKVVGGATGAGIGAYIGGKMGIAALGTAIAGTWPVLLAGGVIGNEVSKRIRHKTPDPEPENGSPG